MFNLGAPEMIFILLLALLIFGPKRLPQLGRTLGKALGEFRRATTDLQRSINLDLDEVDREAERQQAVGTVGAGAPGAPGTEENGPESTGTPSAARTEGEEDSPVGEQDDSGSEEPARSSPAGAETSSAS
ncbi:MAG: twin-arginine translocase TatA/TatE family subunit [Thermoanaerobaculia bacterium]|nr:twin-arginine translocase TatA/TatE family subunit [Thermoanaerobaculia bacterium]